MSSEKKTVIQSLQVGMNIVDLIVHHGQPMKFNDIHYYTKMTKSNLYKYLNTLTQLGILYRDKESGMYMLGSRLIEYGMAAVNRENIIDRITPFLQEINRRCNETVLLSIWTDNGPMIVKMIKGNQSINIGAKIGTYLPAQSASGKIFCTFMDEQKISDWKEKELAKMTEEQQSQYTKELEQIKQEHIAFAKEALAPYVYSVAVPVLNYKRHLLAAVTLVGFYESIPVDINDPISRYLVKMSEEISQAFGFR